jgi:cytochrome c oxidase subunit 2
MGLPRLSVYFDTAKSDVTADFDAAAADIKAYADANPEARFDVSGYNDPRGDAAMNAELSKARAIKVATALVALGIAQSRIDLEKPPETTDTTTTMENARRVDVIVEGSPAE